MTLFADQYFQKLNFPKAQIDRYYDSARRDLNIARTANQPEVKFRFAYGALIKLDFR